MLSPDKGLGKTGFPVSECWKWEEKLGLEGSSGPSPLGLVWRRQPGVGGFQGVSLLPCPPPHFPPSPKRKEPPDPESVVLTTTLPWEVWTLQLPSLACSLGVTGHFHPILQIRKSRPRAICLSPHRELIAGLGLTVFS